MHLYLLRHGRAAERGPLYPEDGRRPLTPEGRERVVEIARGLTRVGVSYDVIATSPYLRALETAELVTETHGTEKKMRVLDALMAGGTVTEAIRALSPLLHAHESVVVVGHEPDFTNLARALIGIPRGPGFRLKKGGLMRIAIDSDRPLGSGVLEWMLTPKQLIALS